MGGRAGVSTFHAHIHHFFFFYQHIWFYWEALFKLFNLTTFSLAVKTFVDVHLHMNVLTRESSRLGCLFRWQVLFDWWFSTYVQDTLLWLSGTSFTSPSLRSIFYSQVIHFFSGAFFLTYNELYRSLSLTHSLSHTHTCVILFVCLLACYLA